MNTPIHDFLKEYSSSNTLRLHMPGHKGKYNLHDITEIKGADSLFEADSIILDSEKNASSYLIPWLHTIVLLEVL